MQEYEILREKPSSVEGKTTRQLQKFSTMKIVITILKFMLNLTL